MRRRTIEPLVCSFCTGIAEIVKESGSSAFYLSKDTFDAVSISVVFVAEIEAVTRAGVFQRCRAVDEKHGVVDVVFLAKFSEEYLG